MITVVLVTLMVIFGCGDITGLNVHLVITVLMVPSCSIKTLVLLESIVELLDSKEKISVLNACRVITVLLAIGVVTNCAALATTAHLVLGTTRIIPVMLVITQKNKGQEVRSYL